jgi:signal transduction histidine kinase
MRQQLHAQNQELEAFAHTVAHDLKSPLTTLIGFLEIMNMDAEEMSESSREMLGNSTVSAHRMHNIIDELLLLASVRNEQVEIVPVDMGAVIDQALGRLGHMFDRYQGEVTVYETWPQVLGYAPWLEEVWVNYLSNGLKYGGQPPHLELGAVVQDDGMTRFWVRDNGSGLDPADQARLFTEFTRLENTRAQGHGLGLSIVRRIMDKLGGQVGIDSAPNQGSQFYFTLPTIHEYELETLR